MRFNLSLRQRLGLGFGVLIALLLVVSSFGLFGMFKLNAAVNQIVLVQNAKLSAAIALRDSVESQQGELLRILAAAKPAEKKRSLGKLAWYANKSVETEQQFRELLKSGASPQETAALDIIGEKAKVAVSAVAQLSDLVKANAPAEQLQPAFKPADQALLAWGLAANELSSVVQKQTDDAVVAATSTFKLSRNLVLGGATIAILAGLLIGWFVARAVLRQLGGEPAYAADVVKQVAEGDLTVEVVTGAKDQNSLLAAMRVMQEKLLQVVQSIRAGMGEVTQGAEQVAQGNADLSQRTQEQASALEEVAASMEELSSTVQQNAENARQANVLAQAAREQAGKGGRVVGSAISAMDEISGSSKRIVDIIGVIDEIAFQTNLLALNAAVEAARAGDMGRGFAVVASEVRNLAQRSATAAKEIKSLIQDSVNKVGEGSRLVNESGQTLEEIVASVRKVVDVVSEIAVASQQQSSGIDQVKQAIMQLDDLTQQNAALVEESAAASESISSEAQQLNGLMGFFRVDGAAAARRDPAVATHAAHPTQATPAHVPAPRLAKPVPRAAPRRAPAVARASAPPAGESGDWEEF